MYAWASPRLPYILYREEIPKYPGFILFFVYTLDLPRGDASGRRPDISASEASSFQKTLCQFFIPRAIRALEFDFVNSSPRLLTVFIHYHSKNFLNFSWEGHTEIAMLLIEKGADIHEKTDYRDTPLHCALWN
jgi:ankyrin repeat protein